MKPKNAGLRAPGFALSSFHANGAAIILILCFAVQAFWHARSKASTFDESAHLAISHLMIHLNNQGFDTTHPPLLRYLFGLPLWIKEVPMSKAYPAPIVPPDTPMNQRPSPNLYYYAAHFLYQNIFPAETLLLWGRAVTLLLGCILGGVVFIWSRKLYGDAAGLLSLGLFAFCPNLIAHGSLITTDMGGAAFAVLFLYALFRLVESSTVRRSLLCGIALGLALLSKFTNLFLPAIFLVLYPLLMARQKKPLKETIKMILLVAAASWLVLCAGYRFENIVGHSLPPEDWADLKFGAAFQKIFYWVPLPQNFLQGFLSVLHHSDRGHSAFLMGQYSVNGWWYYFPLAFAVKTPTTTLFLAFSLLPLFIFRKISISWKESGIVALMAVVLWSAMTAKLNIGIRHILLFYPLLYILMGQLAKILQPDKVHKQLMLLGALLIFEVGTVAPHYLAFFNRASGGPDKGIDYLSDSNIDWGQDLNGLAAFLKREGNPELVMSYFGTGVPPYYGIVCQTLPSGWAYPRSTHINSPNPKKEFLAVSATHLQGTYFVVHDLFAWLRKKKPAAKIGYSIYVYDITDDLESQEKILEIYRLNNRFEFVPRMEERVRLLKNKLGA